MWHPDVNAAMDAADEATTLTEVDRLAALTPLGEAWRPFNPLCDEKTNDTGEADEWETVALTGGLRNIECGGCQHCREECSCCYLLRRDHADAPETACADLGATLAMLYEFTFAGCGDTDLARDVLSD